MGVIVILLSFIIICIGYILSLLLWVIYYLILSGLMGAIIDQNINHRISMDHGLTVNLGSKLVSSFGMDKRKAYPTDSRRGSLCVSSGGLNQFDHPLIHGQKKGQFEKIGDISIRNANWRSQSLSRPFPCLVKFSRFLIKSTSSSLGLFRPLRFSASPPVGSVHLDYCSW